MIVSVHPSTLTGKVLAPASKSSMQRACAAALLSKGTTTIQNPGVSEDDRAALEVISLLGARILSHDREKLIISSEGVRPAASSIHCGESGLGIRMFTPLAALSSKELVITGKGSLLKRPMHFFDEVLPQLGVQVRSTNGHLPITIQGPLTPADIEIDGSLSSQFLTGLLMAYAAAGADGKTIRVKELKSRPYIDLTLSVMARFGVQVENDRYERFIFKKMPVTGPSSGSIAPATNAGAEGDGGFTASTYTVEGDWSGGAFLLVAGAIAGPIVVEGLDTESTQADKEILKALQRSGAALQIDGRSILCGPAALKAFEFDATDCPDLFPPLVTLAASCRGTTTIRGVSRLAHKESDRGIALQQEFGKMGLRIDLEGDLMKVQGGATLRGARVHSHHDHRIAMACAVAALKADSEVIIEEAAAIGKSYPHFYEDLRLVGASVNTKILQP